MMFNWMKYKTVYVEDMRFKTINDFLERIYTDYDVYGVFEVTYCGSKSSFTSGLHTKYRFYTAGTDSIYTNDLEKIIDLLPHYKAIIKAKFNLKKESE
jgi:hypothetical protein